MWLHQGFTEATLNLCSPGLSVWLGSWTLAKFASVFFIYLLWKSDVDKALELETCFYLLS